MPLTKSRLDKMVRYQHGRRQLHQIVVILLICVITILVFQTVTLNRVIYGELKLKIKKVMKLEKYAFKLSSSVVTK